jgi:hypothetical protein
MAQLYRDQFYHYLNVATINGETENPNYVREGSGVESLSVAFNPQKDTFKDITKRTATTTFESYQLSSSISGKRLYSDDAIYTYLDNLRKNAIAGETQLVEINTANSTGTNTYEAVLYRVLITITEWLGENATISYDMDYSNPVVGTATISAGGTISFSPTTSL